MKRITLLALSALVAAIPAAALVNDEHHDVTKRRVVKVVSAEGIEAEEGEDFFFVGDDNEPFWVRSLFLYRGGFLGVQLVDLTPELRRHFGVPEEAGVMISGVSDDGPAARAGIQVGDVITAVGDDEVDSGSGLARLVRAGGEGDVVDLEVWREGKVMKLQAALGERRRPQVDISPFFWKSGDEEEAKAFKMHMESLPENIIQIDEEHIHKALGEVRERLESPEWQDRIRSMVEERRGMEERIHELEARLRQLEERLSKLAQ